jgi:pyrophosphatase PpaX
VNTYTPSATRLADPAAVLFDLDGTVVDTIPHILASFRHATTVVLGEALPDDVLMQHVGVPLARQMYYFTDDEAVAEQLLGAYREFNHRTHDEMARLYPNTRATLETLATTGVPMGIVTSKSRMMTQRALELFGLSPYFAAVVTADDTSVHKPDPLPVLEGLRLLGVDPERAVYVGDSPADIESGNGAGVGTVAATWGVASRERLEAAGPNAIIDDIAELPTVLGMTT